MKNRLASSRSVTTNLSRCAGVAIALTAVVFALSSKSYAAQVEWIDPLQCVHRIRFDAKKYDEKRLLNTVGFIFGEHPVRSFPISQGYDASSVSGTSAYADVCRRHAEQLASLPLVDLPGIEAYRKLIDEQLKDWCDFFAVHMRGRSGDFAALRAYEPSAAHCSRYIDALEGKTDIKQVWQAVVTSACRDNSRPEACVSRFHAAEGQLDEAQRMQADVLSVGWNNCSTRYLKTNSVRRIKDTTEAKLIKLFRKQFKMTREPCAD